MGEIPEMRIVTLGKTGSGKSSLANTLFEEEETFTVNHSANSETQSCQSKNKIINGINIKLVDTPGFFDTNKQKDNELKEELLNCIIECAPGAHAFLLTLKVEKFTSQEEAVVEQMMNYFSEDALKFTTVLFTHGDQLPKGKKIEEWVKENEALQNLVQKCGGRCHVIDNKYWNNSQDPYRNNQHQIKQLLETIYKTIEENEGKCYTNDLLQKVQLMKKHEDRKALVAKLKKVLIGVAIGTLIGAFLGVGVGLVAALVFELLVTGIVAGVGTGIAGGITGGLVKYSGALTEAMKSAAQKLYDHVKSLSKSNPEELVKLLKSD